VVKLKPRHRGQKKKKKTRESVGGGAKVGGERRAPARVANFFALTQF